MRVRCRLTLAQHPVEPCLELRLEVNLSFRGHLIPSLLDCVQHMVQFIGTKIIYERSFLLQLRNSPLAKSPPPNLPVIPGVTVPADPNNKVEPSHDNRLDSPVKLATLKGTATHNSLCYAEKTVEVKYNQVEKQDKIAKIYQLNFS